MDGKTFEDLTFGVLTCLSPSKILRDSIPFDSVREIVISAAKFAKKHGADSPNSDAGGMRNTKFPTRPNAKKNRRNTEFEDMDEATSSSASSHLHNDEANRYEAPVSRFTSTDFDEDHAPPRSISAKNLAGNSTRLSSSSFMNGSSSSPALFSMGGSNDDTKKKSLTSRERRTIEMRQARLKNYRGDFEIVEFECDENALFTHFDEYYWQVLNDPMIGVANLYFRIIETLETYFRGKTWDNNSVKLSCEFLDQSVYKTCQQLNEAHDAKDASDEMRVKELMIQVLVGLHVFTFNAEEKFIDDAIKKLRLIYIAADPQRMRSFVEETLTDIFVEQIAESVASIYDELCISLPADLSHFDSGFKMNDTIEESSHGRRRNGNANKLEQLLAETASDVGNGIGGYDRRNESRRGIKRRGDFEKELISPVKKQLNTNGENKKKDLKRFCVEETPDAKIKQEVADEFDEVVQQTPIAKLRMAANKSGKRCSKRLSELVKLSVDRAQVPKLAKENMEKMLEKAKAATPLRSAKRTTKSILFANNTPSPVSSTRSSRVSLASRFSACAAKQSSPSSSSTPTAEPNERKSSLRTRNNGITRNGNRSTESPPTGKFRFRLKQPKNYKEEEDGDYEGEEVEEKKVEKAKNGKNGKEWTDRRLKSKLGLTRDDLNRYRDAMLAAGTATAKVKKESNNLESGETKRDSQWDNKQVNRAGRVKGAGTVKDEGASLAQFGTSNQNKKVQKIYICHVLLNESNPDTSFDWSKVNDLFDDLHSKPVTRSVQSLLMKPEKILESYKRKFMESSSSSSASSSLPSAKKPRTSGSPKKINTRKEQPSSSESRPKRKTRSHSDLQSSFDKYVVDELGLEPEAE